MGPEDTAGVLVDDIKLALDGRIKDGYRVQLLQIHFHKVSHNERQCYLQNSFLFVLQFCPECPLSEDSEFYNTSAGDRVHVLVCAVPADTGDVTKEKILRKIKEVRKEATVRGESLPVCWLGR